MASSVTPYQNKNQNRSKDKVQNLEKEKRLVCKDFRQDSGHSNFFKRGMRRNVLPKFIGDLYGDAMLVPIWVETNMAAANKKINLTLTFATKA